MYPLTQRSLKYGRYCAPPVLCHGSLMKCSCPLHSWAGSALAFALLFTCRQVYSSVVKIVYGGNTFCFALLSGKSATTTLQKFLLKLSPIQGDALRNLCLSISVQRVCNNSLYITAEELLVESTWKDIFGGDLNAGIKGVANILTGLRILALDFHQSMGWPDDGLLPIPIALAGIKEIQLAELHVSVWLLFQTLVAPRHISTSVTRTRDYSPLD